MPIDYNSIANTLGAVLASREQRRRRAFEEEDLMARRAREDEEYAYRTGQRQRQDAARERLRGNIAGQAAMEAPPSMLRAAALPEPQMQSPFQPPRPLLQKPKGYNYPDKIKGPRSALHPERIDATSSAIAAALTPRVDPELATLLDADPETGMRLYADLMRRRQEAPGAILAAEREAEEKAYNRTRHVLENDRDFDLRKKDSGARQEAASFARKIAEAEEARAAAGFETPWQKTARETGGDIAKEGAKRFLGLLFPSAGENIAATNAAARSSEGAANRASRERIAKMREATATAQMELDRAKTNAKSDNDFKLKAEEIRQRGIAALVKEGDISPSEAARFYGAEVAEGTFSDTITIPQRAGLQPTQVPGGTSPTKGQPTKAQIMARLAELDRKRGAK
jgi:hypothetical protein